MSVKWTFFDAVTNTTFTFPINPTGDSPTYQKTENYEATIAPGVSILLFEGSDQPGGFSITGTILSQNQYQNFVYWYQLRRQFLLTDDLDRQRYIYLTEFQPVRVRNAIYPWKHTYTLSGYFLSEILPTTPVFNANPLIG